MPFLKIDDQEFIVEEGVTVLEAAKSVGIEIPHYCYHPALSIVGSCRMCLVQIEGMGKLQVSCNTVVQTVPEEKRKQGKYDMVVHTQTEVVKQARENILEFLLLNHPLDCPVCDQAGECFLQDYSFRYGRAHSRFDEDKRVQSNEYLGSQIVINHNRCILCSRCVRFTREISGTYELFIQHRGYHSKISVMKDFPIDNLLAGNVTEICPVGALLSNDYIHKNRIWNLTEQKSICTRCSVGCNIRVYSQNNRIFRIDAQENRDVNGFFICDIGRYGFHIYEEMERVTTPLIKTEKGFTSISWEGALKEIYEQFTRKKEGFLQRVGVIVSPYYTNETLFMFRRLLNHVFQKRAIIGSLPSLMDKEINFPSGFRISGDRSPNRKGLSTIFPHIENDFLSILKSQKIRLCFALDDGVKRELDEAWISYLKKLSFLVVQTYAMSSLTQFAHLILPGAAPFEREGTVTNDQNRVQWLKPSLLPPNKSRHNWEIVMEVMNTVGKREIRYSSVKEVNQEMSRQIKFFSGKTFFKLGDKGQSALKIEEVF